MIIKAKEVLSRKDILKPGLCVGIVLYRGPQAVVAKQAKDYANAFLMSGELMPINGCKLRLEVFAVKTSYDDGRNLHLVEIEGVFVDDKKRKE